MGKPLVKLLNEAGHKVYVTSRNEKTAYENVSFIQGNARDEAFFRQIIKENYDVIVDFMVYQSKVFEKRIPLFLEHTDQYFFFSSCRVFAESKEPIIETSPRLLDVINDEDYLATDEYALAKAREENALCESSKVNWTIIRPYITYNTERLQLGVYEKENWLYRATKGRTVVMPKDIASSITTLTSGDDVALAISKLIGNDKAIGETFNISTSEFMSWNEILKIYSNVFQGITGNELKIKYIDNSAALQKVWNAAQIKYDRLYNRKFDNSKLLSVCCDLHFKGIKDGLSDSMEIFLKNPKWLGKNVIYEAWADKFSAEWMKPTEIDGFKTKLRYYKHRLYK